MEETGAGLPQEPAFTQVSGRPKGYLSLPEAAKITGTSPEDLRERIQGFRGHEVVAREQMLYMTPRVAQEAKLLGEWQEATFTTAEAASALGLGQGYIHTLAKQGKLPGAKYQKRQGWTIPLMVRRVPHVTLEEAARRLDIQKEHLWRTIRTGETPSRVNREMEHRIPVWFVVQEETREGRNGADIKTAAESLGMNYQATRLLLEAGRIPAARKNRNGKWRIPPGAEVMDRLELLPVRRARRKDEGPMLDADIMRSMAESVTAKNLLKQRRWQEAGDAAIRAIRRSHLVATYQALRIFPESPREVSKALGIMERELEGRERPWMDGKVSETLYQARRFKETPTEGDALELVESVLSVTVYMSSLIGKSEENDAWRLRKHPETCPGTSR